MKVLKIILIALLIIVGLLLAVAAFLPASAKLERSISIKADTELIYYQVANLRNWETWSPYTHEDMTSTYEGPVAAVGTMHQWTSEAMGDGSLTISACKPYDAVTTKLNMLKRGEGEGQWTFEAKEEAVLVTWAFEMQALQYPHGRIMGLMAEGIMGPQFEQGLKDLKTRCETIGFFAEISEGLTADKWVVAKSATTTIMDIGPSMEESYGALQAFFKDAKVEMAGASLTRYFNWDPEGEIIYDAMFPVSERIDVTDGLSCKLLEGAKVVKYTSKGDYSKLANAHETIDKYIKACGHQVVGAPWEEYVIGPESGPDANNYLTIIYYPIAD